MSIVRSATIRTTNILGTPVLHSSDFVGAGENVDGIALTALSNNNFALAIANSNGVGFLMNLYIVRFMNASGAFTGGAQISSVTDVSAIKIVGLTGGGSAITWHDLTTDAVNYSVFSNTNALILLPTQTGAARRPERAVNRRARRWRLCHCLGR